MSRSNHPAKVTREEILALLQSADYTPMNAAEICTALDLRGGARKAVHQLLDHMVMNGEIVVIRKNRYSLGSPVDLVTGRLEVRRSGDGMLADIEGELPVRVPRGEQGTALPGDVVVVRIDPPEEGLRARIRTGKVIRVVERAKRVIVGTLKSTGRFYYVVPLSPSYQQDFYVPDPNGAKEGDRVVVQFTNWENRHVNPEGEILDVIGPAADPSLDTQAILLHYGFRREFSEEVIGSAEAAAVRLENPGPRLDLRDSFIFTVDPATARDFDDALSLERDESGQRVLGVHIADVSHFVTPGSELDREAAERGNSIYFPDTVLPMLPEQLSNGLCSLKPDQDRLTFSVFLTLAEDGRVLSSRFARSRIRSRLRLTYEQALEIINTPEGMRCAVPGIGAETVARIKGVAEVAQAMRRRRLAEFALDLDLPECEVVMGPDGMIADIQRRENDFAHQMIEECMVAANEAVDRELSRQHYPSMHRLHEPPTEERIDELILDLKDLGYHPGNLKQRRILSAFLDQIRETPLADLAQTMILRSMKRAVYSAQQEGHFGLAKKFYAHFTSPIRRYPDLILHRLLAACLERKRPPYTAERMDQWALHCSWTEQMAEEAERELIEIKKYRFLEQQLRTGQVTVYEAVVMRVVNFGLFVEIPRLEVQGLVHVSALSRQFVRFDHAERALRVGTQSFKVGTGLKVHVSGVDADKRRIDFVLAEGGPVPDRAGTRTAAGPRQGRRPGGRRASTGGPARQGGRRAAGGPDKTA